MKICHVCAFECEDDMELCPKCGAELKNEEFVEQEAYEDETLIAEPVLAVEVEDIITAEVYRDVLKENGIPFTCNGAEDDGSMKVIFGGGFITEDIYVDASNLDRAKELYEQTLEMLENEEFENEEFEDGETFIEEQENSTENE